MAFLEPRNRWLSVVATYSQRKLAYDQDRLPAMSGSAREIHHQSGRKYCAGLWVDDIHRNLCWNTKSNGRPYSSFIAASWSSASLEHHCSYTDRRIQINILPDILEGKWRHRAVLIDYKVVLHDGDPFGCIDYGRLRLRGPWLPALQLITRENILSREPGKQAYNEGRANQGRVLVRIRDLPNSGRGPCNSSDSFVRSDLCRC